MHDVLKVGRVSFFVKELQCGNFEEVKKTECGHSANSVHAKQTDGMGDCQEVNALTSEHEVKEFEKESEDALKCRICWECDASLDNPQIQACLCKGSAAYIHYECLKSWLE